MARKCALVAALAAATAALVAADATVGVLKEDAANGPARATLMVHKRVTAPDTKDIIVVGRPFVVSYHVVNIGASDALNVTLNDDWSADTFELGDQVAHGVWPVIAPGGNETLAVSVKSKVPGTMTSKGATVSYAYRVTDEEGADEEEVAGEADGEEETVLVRALSSAPGRVEIVTEERYAKAVVDTHFYNTAISVICLCYLGYVALNWWSVASANAAIRGPAPKAKRA